MQTMIDLISILRRYVFHPYNISFRKFQCGIRSFQANLLNQESQAGQTSNHQAAQTAITSTTQPINHQQQQVQAQSQSPNVINQTVVQPQQSMKQLVVHEETQAQSQPIVHRIEQLPPMHLFHSANHQQSQQIPNQSEPQPVYMMMNADGQLQPFEGDAGTYLHQTLLGNENGGEMQDMVSYEEMDVVASIRALTDTCCKMQKRLEYLITQQERMRRDMAMFFENNPPSGGPSANTDTSTPSMHDFEMIDTHDDIVFFEEKLKDESFAEEMVCIFSSSNFVFRIRQ